MAATRRNGQGISSRQGVSLQNVVAQHAIDEVLQAWNKADVSALNDQAIREARLLQKRHLNST